MTQEWKAGSVSSSYKEVVKAKLDALTAEEVKKLPYEHGAREFHKWWDRIGLMSEKEDTIMEMDGHRIVVPHGARKNIHKLLHVPHMATARTRNTTSKYNTNWTDERNHNTRNQVPGRGQVVDPSRR